MIRIPRIISSAVFLFAVGPFSGPLAAQPPATTGDGQAPLAAGQALPDLTVTGVEAALAVIEADTGIPDAEKNLLRPRYEQAIAALKKAAEFASQAEAFREAVRTAPTATTARRAAFNALPLAEDAAKVSAPGNTEELQKEVESRRAALNALNDELLKTTTDLARVRGRPVAISTELPDAQSKLSEVERQLASPEIAVDTTSPGRVADRLEREAARSRFLAELDMLKQEQSSQAVREGLLVAQRDLQTRQLENDTAALNALKGLLDKRMAGEVRRFRLLAESAVNEQPQGDQAARDLGAEVQALTKEFEMVVDNFQVATAAEDRITAELERLSQEHTSVSEQLKLGGGGGAMAQVLFDLDQRILSSDVLTGSLPGLDETRLATYQIDAKLREQPEVEQRFAEHESDAVARLVTIRREVLEKLQSQYESLITALAKVEGARRQYSVRAEEIRDAIREELVWLRSSPSISLQTLINIPGGLKWAFRGEHWLELGQALRKTATGMPVRTFGVILLFAALLLGRRRMGAALEKTGFEIRRISTDRYALTGEALVWTCLLAAPLPLVMGFTAWALEKASEPSGWLQNLAHDLQISAWIVLVTGFLVVVCRPGGLGSAHFGWQQEKLARWRSAIQRFTVVYVPAFLLTFAYYLYGDASYYIDSVGRTSFMLAHVWTALVLWQLFRGSHGILATLVGEFPNVLATRWRYLWFPLVIACPLALVVLAAAGYLIAAIKLSLGSLTTVALIAGGLVLYGLALRWFTMKQRKLALAAALEERRARRGAAAAQDQPEPSEEVVTVDPEDEEELDLDAISDQTCVLLRLLCGLAAAVAVFLFWSGTFPLIPVLNAVPIPLTGGLTLLGLTQLVLIGIVTFVAVHNLPGVLELAVLRATNIDAGTRNAISTLCQYAVTGIGLVMLFNVLQVDWAKFGWIAAAFSVGLGFGLQEVVANFVCGLILLFERPLRVGDVVTVEGTTGTVTKIHLRATTITNWNREEFVVPNKTLITSPLTNLTLSSPLNRIVLPVGVAYGSDTKKARQILLDVAADHPLVLEEPAPMASFEMFADSSLNLVLRAYLPDRDNRISTITDLHTEIDKRFAVAGIEIAFPQQDIHIRDGSLDVRGPGGGEDPPQHAPP